jgi:hypothetical protein
MNYISKDIIEKTQYLRIYCIKHKLNIDIYNFYCWNFSLGYIQKKGEKCIYDLQ